MLNLITQYFPKAHYTQITDLQTQLFNYCKYNSITPNSPHNSQYESEIIFPCTPLNIHHITRKVSNNTFKSA